ncbi:MAG: DLW-39 family protein [Acidobacteriota bacterium]|nr:DLW-39 family protein [Acidobacteriota bacterium]
MKRPLQIILAGLILVIGLLTFWNRMRARAEADLWAEATDDL